MSWWPMRLRNILLPDDHMLHNFQKSIDFLLENANPSIKLRVKKEILGRITEEEEIGLKEQILQEKILRFMAEKQQQNGWIGLGFHGSNKNAGQYDNQETATKYMGEKGLQGTLILDKAMEAYITTKLTDLCYETTDWKSKNRKACDITFRALLIMHYASKEE